MPICRTKDCVLQGRKRGIAIHYEEFLPHARVCVMGISHSHTIYTHFIAPFLPSSHCEPIGSIKDIGSLIKPVWIMPAGVVGGKTYSLDDVENYLRNPSPFKWERGGGGERYGEKRSAAFTLTVVPFKSASKARDSINGVFSSVAIFLGVCVMQHCQIIPLLRSSFL